MNTSPFKDAPKTYAIWQRYAGDRPSARERNELYALLAEFERKVDAGLAAIDRLEKLK